MFFLRIPILNTFLKAQATMNMNKQVMPQYSKVLRTKMDCFLEIVLFSFSPEFKLNQNFQQQISWFSHR